MPGLLGRYSSLAVGLALLSIVSSPVRSNPASGDLLSGHLNLPTAEAVTDPSKGVVFLTTGLEFGQDSDRLVIDFADGVAGATLSLGDPRSRGHRFLVDPNIKNMNGLPAGTYQACWMELRKDEQRMPLKSLGCWAEGAKRQPAVGFTVNPGDMLYLGHLRARPDGLTTTVLIAETLLKPGIARDPAFNQGVEDKLAVNGLTKQDIHGYLVRTLSDGSTVLQVWLDEQKIPAGTLRDLLIVPKANSMMGQNTRTLMRIVFSVEDRFAEFATTLSVDQQNRVRKALLLQPGQEIVDALPVSRPVPTP